MTMRLIVARSLGLMFICPQTSPRPAVRVRPMRMICLACGYSKSVHNKAATVCAEGVGHSDGTHGTLHTKTDEVSKKHLVL
ncbi:hypothetical protein KDW99_01530 [Marinomonas rhizomae]|nr:hypothetical protein KDW99_01530 [Marinomonas rhizomae]